MKKHTNHNDEPLVSIITPVYNASQFLEETLDSVQAQSYQNWEHILVNDASTDTSKELLESRSRADERIKVITLSTNKGAAHARNLATDAAQGLYISFLDADDLWHPRKLEKQISFMQDHHCAVSFTSYVHINENSQEIGKRIIALKELTYEKQHSNNYVGNLTGVYNMQSMGKISAPNIRKRQDWALWLEAIERSKKPALGIEEDLAYYRIREDSMSATKWKLIKYNFLFYRKYLGYSFPKSIFWLFKFFREYFVIRPEYIEKYEAEDS